MTLHNAKKVVIITEKFISKKVSDIIEQCGATGYTTVLAGGKGDRNIRSTTERASVIDDFANIKFEIIVNHQSIAEEIMTKVTEKYFKDYPGITYMEDVEILRPKKFD
jgi:nitrogen regulatory protein PII